MNDDSLTGRVTPPPAETCELEAHVADVAHAMPRILDQTALKDTTDGAGC